MIKAGYRPKCEICARVCPVGEAPHEIAIQDKSTASQALNRIVD
jgi:ferredoxin